MEPELLGIETASSLRSESLKRSLFFCSHKPAGTSCRICRSVCVRACVSACASVQQPRSSPSSSLCDKCAHLPPSPPYITDSPSLFALSPLSSLLRKLLLASLLTFFHCSLPGQWGLPLLLLPLTQNSSIWQIFTVMYPGLCNVPNPAPAPLALDPEDKRPYFETLQHILALVYSWFNTFNKMFAGGNSKRCQRYPMKIEPHVSVDCNGAIVTLYHWWCRKANHKGRSWPLIPLWYMGNRAG